MKKITISGGSDDLIEIEGDIRSEFYGGSDEGEYLAFSDGTLLKIIYTQGGIWKVSIAKMNAEIIDRFDATDSDGDEYSDRLTIKGDFQWIICGKGKIIK